MTTTLWYANVDTGERRQSRRADVWSSTMQWLPSLVETARHGRTDLLTLPGYWLEVDKLVHATAFAIGRKCGPLAVCVLATDAASVIEATTLIKWRPTAKPLPPLPWLLVRMVHPEAMSYSSILRWRGNIERGVAWCVLDAEFSLRSTRF